MDDIIGASVHLTKSSSKIPLQIAVHLKDGSVWSYDVPSLSMARRDIEAIGASGYTRVGVGFLRHYPPHQVDYVQVTGDSLDMPTNAHQRPLI